LLDKTLAQLKVGGAKAVAKSTVVSSLAKRTASMLGN
jgi:hypothetical protein